MCHTVAQAPPRRAADRFRWTMITAVTYQVAAFIITSYKNAGEDRSAATKWRSL